jgi:hypothetical protein
MKFAERLHPAYGPINLRDIAKGLHGSQMGDPAKAAAAMYKLAVMKDPPFRLVLGEDAYPQIMARADGFGKEFEKSKELSLSCSFDKTT